MELVSIVNLLPASWQPYAWLLIAITGVIGSSSVLTAILPSGTTGLWGYIRKFLDICAANVGNAKNASK